MMLIVAFGDGSLSKIPRKKICGPWQSGYIAVGVLWHTTTIKTASCKRPPSAVSRHSIDRRGATYVPEDALSLRAIDEDESQDARRYSANHSHSAKYTF